MIETHVHFNIAPLSDDPGACADRAAEAGVSDCVVVGFDVASSETAVRQAESHPRIWAVVGVHPQGAAAWDDAAARRLRDWAAHPRVLAIGEIGIDTYRDHAPLPLQRAVFREQLDLARECGLPVVLHCRSSEDHDATQDVLDLLEERDALAGSMVHCFSGTPDQARRIWEAGGYLGIDGPVTYKKNDTLRRIVADAPATCLLLETDAPYLSPEPLRGRFPNEPARLTHIAAAVAAARGESLADVDRQTTANACRAFPRLRPTV